MLFFYNGISNLNATYSHLFGTAVEETTEGKQGNGQGEDNGETGGNSFADKWNWMYSIKQVSDMVHSPWDVVFQMNIIEFLNILCFVKDYNREVERINKERINKHK